jgi:hypothetical protein
LPASASRDQEQHELGIDSVFWKGDPTAAVAQLAV